MATALRRTGTPVAPAAEPATPARVIRPGAARARAAQQHEAKLTVNTSAYGNETTKDEVIETKTFASGIEPAFVRISAGKTLNLGNYESLRVDAALTMPCLPTQDEIAKTFEQVSEIVAEQVLREEQEWLGAQSKPKANRRD